MSQKSERNDEDSLQKEKWVDKDAMRLIQKSKKLLEKMQVICELHEGEIKEYKKKLEEEKEKSDE